MRFPFQAPDFVCLPDVDTVHWVHDEIALYEGGSKGLRDEGAVMSALGRPMHVITYSQDNPDLITLAAYLCHGIALAHGYVDGNKRTSVLVMMAFLAQNGVSYDAGEDEIGLLMEHWFQHMEFSVPVIEAYLRTRCHWARA